MTPSNTPSHTSTPSANSFKTLLQEVVPRAYRFAITAIGRTSLTTRRGPRAVPTTQLLPEGLTRLYGETWTSGDWATLLNTGAIAGASKLSPPTPLPAAYAAAITADTTVLVISPAEPTVLGLDLWVFNSQDVDNTAALLGRGVAVTSDSWLIHRPLTAMSFTSDLVATTSNSGTPTPSRTPVNKAGAASASGTPTPLPAFTIPTGLTYVSPAGHLLTPISATITFTGTPTLAYALTIFSSSFLAQNYVRDNQDIVTFKPSVVSTTITIPAGLLKPGYVYRIDAKLRLRALWSYAYSVTPWDRPAVFTNTFRRAEGEGEGEGGGGGWGG